MDLLYNAFEYIVSLNIYHVSYCFRTNLRFDVTTFPLNHAPIRDYFEKSNVEWSVVLTRLIRRICSRLFLYRHFHSLSCQQFQMHKGLESPFTWFIKMHISFQYTRGTIVRLLSRLHNTVTLAWSHLQKFLFPTFLHIN